MDDDMLEDDDELVGAGIPLLDDDDGDVGILTGDEDEMEGMTLKGENGEELEDEM